MIILHVSLSAQGIYSPGTMINAAISLSDAQPHKSVSNSVICLNRYVPLKVLSMEMRTQSEDCYSYGLIIRTANCLLNFVSAVSDHATPMLVKPPLNTTLFLV